MNAPFAAKRPVQLELDTGLVERAEARGASLASTVEAALAAHLAAREAAVADHQVQAAAYATASATFIERYGAWGEEFSTLR